jgi:hypothetical protein
LTSAAAFGGQERVTADRLLRREGHPLGVRRYYADPADEVAEDAAGTNRKWTFGVAAGALLVAGTFAAGALGLNGGTMPLAGENAPEHAPSAPGHGPNNPGDIGTPAVAAPPHGDRHEKAQPGKRSADEADGATAGGRHAAGSGGATGATGGSSNGSGGAGQAQSGGGQPATPAPAPAPAPAPNQGGLGQVVTPVTDTVGDVVAPVSDTVGGVLSPVTGVLSGGNQQPAMTMINPLGDLLGH